MEKINLLIENIPHFKLNNHIIFDDTIDFMTNGALTYLSDGKNDEYYNRCDIYDFKKNQDTQYLFVLSVHMLNWDVFGDLLLLKNTFSNLLRDLLFAKNVKCAFVDVHESDDLTQLKRINKIFSRFNIDKTKVWFLNNDSNIEAYVIKNKLGLQVKKIHHLATTFTHSLFYNQFEFQPKTDSNSFFLCINKRAKMHRVLTLSYLKNMGLLDQTNYSLLENMGDEDEDFHKIIGHQELNRIKDDVDFILKNRPKQTNYEAIKNTDLVNVENYVFAGIIELDDYKEPLINITGESMYETESIHITEKSFKPFGLCHLPILVASPFHVKKMKEHYGLDFFDDLIDHSYDSEIDHGKRLLMIVDEIKRLYTIKDEVITFYNLNKDRFIKNRKLVESITNEKWDYNFFKETILCK